MSEHTPRCACNPPHEENDPCACPCHEPDPVQHTLAIVSGRVHSHKSKYTLGYDLERALSFTLASLHAGGGSPVAERNRLLHLAALCVKKVTADDVARRAAREARP